MRTKGKFLHQQFTEREAQAREEKITKKSWFIQRISVRKKPCLSGFYLRTSFFHLLAVLPGTWLIFSHDCPFRAGTERGSAPLLCGIGWVREDTQNEGEQLKVDERVALGLGIHHHGATRVGRSKLRGNRKECGKEQRGGGWRGERCEVSPGGLVMVSSTSIF